MTANNTVDAGGTTPVTFGSVSAPSGVGGTAASFSGDGNYLSTSLPVTTSAGWALEAWMNPALSAEQTAFVLYNGDDAAGYGFGESGQHTPSSPGACIEYLAGDVGWQYNGGGCLSPGWNYVEVSSNGTGSINGVSYTFSIGAPNSPVCATTIGTELGAGCGFRNGRQFTGAIAGAAVYNHPLSASDALAHYNAGE
jgi:hypothetical protein